MDILRRERDIEALLRIWNPPRKRGAEYTVHIGHYLPTYLPDPGLDPAKQSRSTTPTSPHPQIENRQPNYHRPSIHPSISPSSPSPVGNRDTGDRGQVGKVEQRCSSGTTTTQRTTTSYSYMHTYSIHVGNHISNEWSWDFQRRIDGKGSIKVTYVLRPPPPLSSMICIPTLQSTSFLQLQPRQVNVNTPNQPHELSAGS